MPKLTFLNPQGPASTGPLTIDCKRGISILDAAEECGARVGHACGGNLACSTCHVWIHEGLDLATKPFAQRRMNRAVAAQLHGVAIDEAAKRFEGGG